MRYSENPNLGLPVVTSVTGKQEYQSYCRLNQGNWYIIDEECILSRRWYYIDRDEFFYDHELKKNTISLKKMIHGIVEFDEDKLPVLGHFTPNPYYNALVVTALGKFNCIDYRNAEALGFIEEKATGVFYDPKALTLSQLHRILRNSADLSYKNKGYNIEDNAGEFEAKKELYEKYPLDISKQAKRFAKFLGDTTWGCEVEFAGGGLPDRIQNQLGIVMCRDGSTSSGGEAVLVPYKGAKGLQSMKNLGKEAVSRLQSDLSCSFHIHVGNLDLSRSYLAALYRLCIKIQDDVFPAFPYYKTDPSGIKNKNYNKKLKPLFKPYQKGDLFSKYSDWEDNAYTQMFRFLSDGQLPCYTCNKEQAKHPINEKWNRPSRYYWVNLQNAIFSNRRTIEFRLHHATLNGQKMINWLFICNAICKYAERHMNDLLVKDTSISLDDVLGYYKEAFPTSYLANLLTEYLIAYVASRKADFKKDFSNRDFAGVRELDEDKNYLFSYKGIDHLF